MTGERRVDPGALHQREGRGKPVRERGLRGRDRDEAPARRGVPAARVENMADRAPGIEHGAHMAMYYADDAVVVTNPEVSSVRDSDRMLGILASKSRRAETNAEPIREYLLLTRYSPERVANGEMLSVEDVQEILSLDLLGVIPERPAKGAVKLILSPIGSQGFILGRGNQQLSVEVLKRLHIEDIIIVSTPGKLKQTPFLRVDIPDPELQKAFIDKKYFQVTIGYRTMRMVPIN